MKKGAVVLLCLLFLATGGITAYANPSLTAGAVTEAAGVIDFEPFWTNTATMSVTLSFNNGRGALSGSVVGQPGTTHITATAILERRNANGTYSHIASWPITAQGNILFWGRDHFVVRGHTYRLTLNATVFRNGFGENVSLSISRFAN